MSIPISIATSLPHPIIGHIHKHIPSIAPSIPLPIAVSVPISRLPIPSPMATVPAVPVHIISATAAVPFLAFTGAIVAARSVRLYIVTVAVMRGVRAPAVAASIVGAIATVSAIFSAIVSAAALQQEGLIELVQERKGTKENITNRVGSN